MKKTVLLFCTALSLAAEPFKPADENFLVERLPASLRGTRRPSLQPQDAAAAYALARDYLQIAQRTSDDAFVRYAERVLERWPMNTEAQFLSAVISQHKHQFDQALAQIDRLLQVTPNHEGAALLKASILTTQGRYSDARAVFASDLRLVSGLQGLTIFLNLASLSGALDRSEAQLAQALERPGKKAELAFAWSVLAEMQVRQGDTTKAENSFRKALEFEPDNAYTIAAYSDLLLSEKQNAEVLKLIPSNAPSDALLTRRALASSKLDDALLARLRSNGHRREVALIELEVLNQPELALDSARANWENQKEPVDVILLLKSALRAGQKSTTMQVVEWLRMTGLQDKRALDLMKTMDLSVVQK